MASENSLFSSVATLIKNGKNFSAQGKIGSAAVKWGKRITAGMGIVALGILAYMYKLGMAAFKGAIVGATIGGVAGAGFGGFLGFQVGVALAPFTFGLSIPVFTVLGAALGAATGAAIGALAGGLIGYGLASGSGTAVSMGVGAGIGGVVGGVLGATAGAAAVAWIPVIGPFLAPFGAMVGATIGAAVGATVGAAAGYAIGNYIVQPAGNFISGSIQGIKGFFQSSGSGAHGEYAGSGAGQGSAAQSLTGSALGSAGNFIAGFASGVWNGAIGMAGNAIGWGSSLLSGGFNLLSTGATAASATVAKVAVGGAIGTVTTVSIVSSISTNTAFSSPEGDLETTPPAGENADFIIAKTASPANISAPGPEITFTITLTAKSQPIADVGFVDNLRYSKNGVETDQTRLVPTFTCSLPINPGQSCTNQFKYPTALNTPPDSLIINTVLAAVTLADGSKKQDTSTVSVPVGAPTSNCPQGWPTPAGTITQGVQGGFSHAALYPGEQAIDIGGAATTDTPTFATFSGTVTNINPIDDNGYGIYVDVEGLCNGQKFTARWAHLSSPDARLAEGGSISNGSPIGQVGDTGRVTGPHLHYSFFDLTMTTPYIPQAPANTCIEPNCGVSW